MVPLRIRLVSSDTPYMFHYIHLNLSTRVLRVPLVPNGSTYFRFNGRRGWGDQVKGVSLFLIIFFNIDFLLMDELFLRYSTLLFKLTIQILFTVNSGRHPFEIHLKICI